MDREKFSSLVAQAVADLPPQFYERLENVDVVVEDQPTAAQLAKARVQPRQTLFGLYEGVPLTKRSSDYGNVLPDKVTIFQNSIEAAYRDDEIASAIWSVLRHEIAHHFGISDDRLQELGK
jgi:predicted Zn-dependent protease with MMP-like domain